MTLLLPFVALVAAGSDPFYTHFHAQPIKNWLNDPNGPMFFNGYYHLFFQYNPKSKKWGDMHWYHMKSKDMLHWEHLPVALAPDQPYDCGGIFSGSATVFHNASSGKDIPILTYSVACGKAIVNALPADLTDVNLTKWMKPSYDPVIEVPKGVGGGFRDPTTAWEGEDKVWRLLVGCGNGEGTCQFKSKDFVKWTYVGAFHSHGGGMWECPDFYKIPNTDTYVLKASAGGDWWATGRFVEQSDPTKADSFVPSGFDIHDNNQKYDFGTFYASKTFHDTVKDRQILFGWVNYGCPNTDWTGIQTFPRTVSLDPANASMLVTYPIPEISDLYEGSAMTASDVQVVKGTDWTHDGMSGNQLDIEVEFALPNATAGSTSFGVKVLGSLAITITANTGSPVPAGNFDDMPNMDMPGDDYNVTKVSYDDHTICKRGCEGEAECKAWTFVPAGFDRLGKRCCYKKAVPNRVPRTGLFSGVPGAPPVPPPPAHADVHAEMNGHSFLVKKDAITLRVLVDHSVVEAFAQGGRAVQTMPHCPGNPATDIGFSIFNNGNAPLKVNSVTVHKVATANYIPNP